MSQQAVERAIGKLVTDDAFREQFGADSVAASRQAGLSLSMAELAALSRIPRLTLEALASCLDDGIRRLVIHA